MPAADIGLASPSARSMQCDDASIAASYSEYLPHDTAVGAAELNSDLVNGIPPLFESSVPMFENDLELGQFFAPEFQKWLERHSA